MRRAAYAHINLNHLKQNFAEIKKITPQSKIMAVVKADAYGHGMLQVCKTLSSVDAFSVACVNEALELRENGVSKPVLSLQGFNNTKELQSAIEANVEVVIHEKEQINLLQSLNQKISLNVHVKLDSGMNRLGFSATQFIDSLSKLKKILSPTSTINVMTHLACADELDNDVTKLQLEKFDQAVNGYDYSHSIANSAAILAWPQSHRQWVRPGLVLYGVNPLHQEHSSHSEVPLRPVMSLCAPVITIKNCNRGEKIGYGGDYYCEQDMVVAIVAVGYADGYPCHLTQTSFVSINGHKAPIIGRVSMDMIAVDVSEVQTNIGDEVELWGENISVTDVARNAKTICYELLCTAGYSVYKKFIN